MSADCGAGVDDGTGICSYVFASACATSGGKPTSFAESTLDLHEKLDIGEAWISAMNLLEKSVPGFISPLVTCDDASVCLTNFESDAVPA